MGVNITTYEFSSSQQVRDIEQAQKHIRDGLDKGYSATQLQGLLSNVSGIASIYFAIKRLPLASLAAAFASMFIDLFGSSKRNALSEMQHGINALGDLAYYMETNNIEAVEVDMAYCTYNAKGETIRYFCSADYILKRIKKDGRWMLLG